MMVSEVLCGELLLFVESACHVLVILRSHEPTLCTDIVREGPDQ